LLAAISDFRKKGYFEIPAILTTLDYIAEIENCNIINTKQKNIPMGVNHAQRLVVLREKGIDSCHQTAVNCSLSYNVMHILNYRKGSPFYGKLVMPNQVSQKKSEREVGNKTFNDRTIPLQTYCQPSNLPAVVAILRKYLHSMRDIDKLSKEIANIVENFYVALQTSMPICFSNCKAFRDVESYHVLTVKGGFILSKVLKGLIGSEVGVIDPSTKQTAIRRILKDRLSQDKFLNLIKKSKILTCPDIWIEDTDKMDGVQITSTTSYSSFAKKIINEIYS
jgi:hypothetical protein